MISQETAPRHIWGDRCDGWHLVQADGLSVIHERMPPHAAEVRHHQRAERQFFFVLSSIVTMEHGDEFVELQSSDGVEIGPGVSHRIRNEMIAPPFVRSLLIADGSAPLIVIAGIHDA